MSLVSSLLRVFQPVLNGATTILDPPPRMFPWRQYFECIELPLQMCEARSSRPSSTGKISFEIAELIGEVARHSSPSTQASLARVSKQCHHEVIRALWRVVPSVLPLLRLVPNIRKVNGEWILRSGSLDWTRFDMHAKHVLYVVAFTSEALWETKSREHNAIFHICHSLRPDVTLLSRLKHISLPSLQGVPTITSFLSQTLLVARMRLPNSSHNFLQDIYESCPHIAHIYLSGNIAVSDLQRLRVFKSLNSFILDFLDLTSPTYQLEELLLPPNISKLGLYFRLSFQFRLLRLSTLSNLRFLHLKGHFRSIATILGAVNNLEQVIIEISDHEIPSTEVQLSWHALASNSGHSLHTVKIFCKGGRELYGHLLMEIPAMSYLEVKAIFLPNLIRSVYTRSIGVWTIAPPEIGIYEPPQGPETTS